MRRPNGSGLAKTASVAVNKRLSQLGPLAALLCPTRPPQFKFKFKAFT